MRYKTVSGLTLPQVGIGTYMGKCCDVNTPYGEPSLDENRDRNYRDALQLAISLGAKHLDTSEIYGSGHSEKLIGEALFELRSEDFRDLFVSTKVGCGNLNYADVLSSCRSSLDRLGVEDVDLYSIHRPNKDVPIGETIRAMDELVDSEIISYLGIGNANLDLIKQANELSRHGISAVQIQYNFIPRDLCGQDQRVKVESEILPYCQENGILVIAHNPFDREFELMNPANLELLEQIADKHDASKAQVAISWLLAKANVVSIFESTNLDDIRENVAAADLELDDDEYALIDQISGINHLGK